MNHHVKLKTISLKAHPSFDESWVQQVIADDPGLLGIPSVAVKDRERSHKGGGRLDMLLEDEDENENGRYEVEIQLGATDESHIIRTIEYWDRERRMYPQYEHTAVLIAEDTSRFLNVVSVFNGHIPLMVLKLTAIEMTDGVGLVFTKVLDTVRLGLVGEDETVNDQVTRNDWETQQSNPTIVKIADKVYELCKEFAPDLLQTYKKNYIGFKLGNRAFNFALCKPKAQVMIVEIHLEKTDERDAELQKSGLDVLAYNKHFEMYRIRLKEKDIQDHKVLLTKLLRQAFDNRS